jgi:glutamate racemase
MKRKAPIGFLDSGAGGISVMLACRKLLPYENFILYGDSANAPYGEKSEEEIKRLALTAAEKLLEKNIKALVIACNTITTIAGELLYSRLNIPVIGTVPALKEGKKLLKGGQMLVMLTPASARSQTMRSIMQQYGADAKLLPCPGLMEFVERGEIEGERLNNKLKQLLSPYKGENIDVVVLACTHYPFLLNELRKHSDDNTIFIDGSSETLKTLIFELNKKNILCNSEIQGYTQFISSEDNNTVDIMKKLYILGGGDEKSIID